MNLRVNLTKRVRTAEGLRYCPVVESANGRIKPDWVAVDGQEEKHPEGELKTLYAVSNATEKLLWDFFLMTGMREQESLRTFAMSSSVIAMFAIVASL
jgi:hypothetical protein